ncbi:MAG TPA: hypothetical protein VJN67_20645 [Stellaceae bacterium]|nr:hypothetical protein [Stellaceae bacterium]
MPMSTLSRRSAGKLIAAAAIVAPAAALVSQSAAAYEPNMENALHALEDAHTWLERASPNKGGHRARAIAMVEQAINEVRAGIAYSGG